MEPPGKDHLFQDSTLGFAGDVEKWVVSQRRDSKCGEDGVFRTRLAGARCIVVSGYDACKEALERPEFVASEAYSELLSGVLGETTMLTMEDNAEMLRLTKSILLGAIHHASEEIIGKSVVPTVMKEVEEKGGSVVLYEVVRDAVMDAILQEVIGPHHMEDRKELVQLLKDHFRATSKPPVRAGIGNLWKTGFQRGLDARDKLLKRFEEVVKIYEPPIGEGCPPYCTSLLCSMFTANNNQKSEGKESLMVRQIAGVMLILSNSIIPKTVGTLIASASAVIAQDAELHASLIEELKTCQNIQTADVSKSKELPKLRACVRETVRLWPALVAAPRKCVKATTFRGFNIPEDRYVIIMLLAANRDPVKYGDLANTFSVSRWEQNPGLPQPLSWGGGVRLCGGQDLAERLALAVLTALLRKYSTWQIAKGSQNKFKWLPVTAHKEPVRFVFKG